MTPEAGRQGAEPVAWWAVDAVLLRFIENLITDELGRLRPGGSSKRLAAPWDPALDIGRDLGVDSLERLAIASALSEALHLGETGIKDDLLVRTTLGDWAAVARTSLRGCSERLTFRTSGSSGRPKACTHALAALEEEITELAPLFRGCARLVSAVPSHHIYGFLFTVLLPRRLGIAEIPVLEVRGSSPVSVPPLLRAGDLVIGHPEFWRNVARVGRRIPAGVTGVTSTGPLPEGVGGDLAKLGLARLVQIYGS
jgi:4-coumarate--CoA ligase (photoactive yellow protein activation family)